jgi:ribosome biogenesis GTPase
MIDFDFESLRHIGLNQAIVNQLDSLGQHGPSARLARITEVQRHWFTVDDGYARRAARARSSLIAALEAADTGLAIGDWVLVEASANDEHWIGARMAPLTQIVRRANDQRRQVLACNVDTALLVMGLDHDFNARRIERYLALTQAAGIAPVIVLTKRDIGIEVAPRLAQLERRWSHQVPLLALNGRSAEAAQALAPWLGAGQTLIMLGSSGAGKSTLANTLAACGQPTGAVRKGDGRGHHTTSARTLHRCPGGACLIDTPGLRSVQLDLDPAALAATFDDIDALSEGCQFRDCSHAAEPGCAVRDAVDPDRLRNYQKLLREARRGAQTPLDRIAATARWKVQLRASAQRERHRRGD